MSGRPSITIDPGAIEPPITHPAWYALGHRPGKPWRAYRQCRYREDAEIAFLNLTGVCEHRALVRVTAGGIVRVERSARD